MAVVRIFTIRKKVLVGAVLLTDRQERAAQYLIYMLEVYVVDNISFIS